MCPGPQLKPAGNDKPFRRAREVVLRGLEGGAPGREARTQAQGLSGAGPTGRVRATAGSAAAPAAAARVVQPFPAHGLAQSCPSSTPHARRKASKRTLAGGGGGVWEWPQA